MSHGHSHSHSHSHGHSHAPKSYTWAFGVGIFLNLAFVGAEFFYGQLSNSLALIADAGHNLSDVFGLALAWGAAVLSRQRPTPSRTYGMRRSSILAALINAVVLLIALGTIAWEAFHRLGNPAPVAEQTVMWVAAIGMVINAVTAMFFFSGSSGDMNIRGAFLHMVADAAVSAGVVVSGYLVLKTGWFWLDPAVSLLICGIIVVSTWGLLRDSLNLALDGVPEGIDLHAVDAYLLSLPNVVGVHDLHVWGMSTTEAALTAHLVMAEPVCDNAFLRQVEQELHHRFGIEHATLQLETGDSSDCQCRLY
ncbi:cation diffusion facilitator family transporter [Bryobacter aggregatus]|uniref:cation diffusion facilitator family transporter n=1 Tax=Bryobacter aggregatus TaxID=360054 RepID=UPI0004E1D836|nr:cation diffusion facilitator family transporter [Bryobacter aggregatus]